MSSINKRPLCGAIALAGAVTLLLTSCTPEGGGDETEAPTGSAQEGVAFGASKEEWIAAFEDVEQVTLTVQTSGPQGSATGRKEEAYFQAVEEWSGGKVSFDIGYAYAYAPILEADDALADGILDMATIIPTYEAAKFPVSDLISRAIPQTSGGALTMPMHIVSWVSEASLNTPEYWEEYSAAGLHPLLPANIGGRQLLFCDSERTSLSDLDGGIAAASSSTVADAFGELGMSTIALPVTDFYEAMQRGVMNCYGSSTGTLVSTGLQEVSPYAIYSPEAPLAIIPGPFVMSEERWNSLPLVTKQLLFDRLDVMIGVVISDIWDAEVEMIELLEGAGGGLLDFEQDATDVLIDYNTGLIDSIAESDGVVSDGGELADRLVSTSEEWIDIITGELGIDESVTMRDLGAWLSNNEIDLSAFSAKMLGDQLAEYRPTE